MNDSLFKAFVAAAIIFLAAAIKNPASARVQKLRRTVEQIYDVAGQFLAVVPGENQES